MIKPVTNKRKKRKENLTNLTKEIHIHIKINGTKQ